MRIVCRLVGQGGALIVFMDDFSAFTLWRVEKSLCYRGDRLMQPTRRLARLRAWWNWQTREV
jgi:hypothetical protein